MATQAKVTSTEALETFRASLIVFRGKAKKSVDEVAEQVSRTRMWLQHDQRTHWEGEFRRRTKALQQAEQELSSARLTAHNESAMMARQAQVAKMRRAIAEAEDKLRRIKSWTQNYDSRVDPLAKRLESLRQYLDTDLPKAIGYLANAQKILADYAGGPSPSSESSATPASEAPSATETGAAP
jgi:chromosome segregation ATPase